MYPKLSTMFRMRENLVISLSNLSITFNGINCSKRKVYRTRCEIVKSHIVIIYKNAEVIILSEINMSLLAKL